MFNYEEKTREDRLEGHTETERVALCAAALMKTICFQTHLLLLLRPQLKHKLTDVAVDVSMPTHAHACTYLYFNTFTKKKSWEPPPIYWFDLSVEAGTDTHTHSQKHTQKKKHNRPVCWHVVWITARTPCLPRSESVCLSMCVCIRVCWQAVGEPCLATIRDNSTQITTLITTILKSHLWLS